MNKEYWKELRSLHHYVGTLITDTTLSCTWDMFPSKTYRLVYSGTYYYFNSIEDTYDTSLCGKHRDIANAIAGTFQYPTIHIYCEGILLTVYNYKEHLPSIESHVVHI